MQPSCSGATATVTPKRPEPSSWRGTTRPYAGSPPKLSCYRSVVRLGLGGAKSLRCNNTNENEDGQDEDLLHADNATGPARSKPRGVRPIGRLDREQVASACVGRGVTQLRHGSGFNLTNALPGQIEVLTHLFQGAGLAPVKSEAKSEDLTLALVER